MDDAQTKGYTQGGEEDSTVTMQPSSLLGPIPINFCRGPVTFHSEMQRSSYRNTLLHATVP